jgi:uroporphyrinogen III methyltransferase/synthase
MKTLSGRVILVTRPKSQSAPLIRSLTTAGARVFSTPLIRISPPTSYKGLDTALKQLKTFDALLFTSRNAVDSFFTRAKTKKLTTLRPQKLYAIGPETNRALNEHGWPNAKTPKTHHGEALARALGNVRGLNILIPRAKVAREILPQLLRKKGAKVTVVEAYRTTPELSSMKIIKKEARKGISAITFTSGSTVDNFIAQFGKTSAKNLFKTTHAVSIGPITSAALRKHGIKPAAQAKHATSTHLAQAIKHLFNGQ